MRNKFLKRKLNLRPITNIYYSNNKDESFGLYETFYKNKVLGQTGVIIKDEQFGIWKDFFNNGSLHWIESLDNSFRYGIRIKFDYEKQT